jgi:multidrug efflux pump subunit AcrB
MMANERPNVWLAAGLRTPFVRVDGAIAKRDSLMLSVPVVQEMAKQVDGKIDFGVWGSVVLNLGYRTLSREVWLEAGLDPRSAAYKSMDEVGQALIAIALVLCAVFVPSIFITGISGQFYRQFALTIASATVISLIVSLTLSPAMCALLLKPRERQPRPTWWSRSIRGFFRAFNWGFDRFAGGYHWLISRAVRLVAVMLVLYVAILGYGLNEFRNTPTGFIPQVDRGYLITVLQLPPGASLARTDEVQRRVVEICLHTPGVAHAVSIVGFSGATFTNAPNSGAVFLILDDWADRGRDPKLSVLRASKARQRCQPRQHPAAPTGTEGGPQ